jgi:hypothetical protein
LENASDELPPEVKQSFQTSGQSDLLDLKLMMAIPEWEVELPGGMRSSHTDVLVLASNKEALVVIGVEAKVDEPFGPTLGKKRAEKSTGQSKRIDYLHTVLRLDVPLKDEIRYQLLHRTVSALRTAQDFHADAAVMLSIRLAQRAAGAKIFHRFAMPWRRNHCHLIFTSYPDSIHPACTWSGARATEGS